MTKRVRNAIKLVMESQEGSIFFSYLLTQAGVFQPQKDPDKLAVQQFFIKVQCDLDLFTTRGDFPLRYVQSLMTLPRSGDLTKEEEVVNN